MSDWDFAGNQVVTSHKNRLCIPHWENEVDSELLQQMRNTIYGSVKPTDNLLQFEYTTKIMSWMKVKQQVRNNPWNQMLIWRNAPREVHDEVLDFIDDRLRIQITTPLIFECRQRIGGRVL